MDKIKIYSVGKTKEAWLSEAIEKYIKRLKPVMSIEWHIAKTMPQLVMLLEKESHWICLDPQGTAYDSESFSSFLYRQLENQGCRLNFVIGGAEGLPRSIIQSSIASVSLSKLTFTHQIARLILLEQLYRAAEIRKGSQYHK